MLAVRLPAEPSRHRVAVWRELRRVGALSLGQGVWALPATPAFEQGLARAVGLIDRGEGDALILEARGRDESQAGHLEALFTAGREEEWAEFVSECAKYEAELDRELQMISRDLTSLRACQQPPPPPHQADPGGLRFEDGDLVSGDVWLCTCS